MIQQVDELQQRLARLYAAVDAVADTQVENLRPDIASHGNTGDVLGRTGWTLGRSDRQHGVIGDS